MNKKIYGPKLGVLSGVILLIIGILMKYAIPNVDDFISGIIIGMGFGVILSYLYRVFKIDE